MLLPAEKLLSHFRILLHDIKVTFSSKEG